MSRRTHRFITKRSRRGHEASTQPISIVAKELPDDVRGETFEDEFLSVKSLDVISRAAAERPARAKEVLDRVLAEDRESNYLSPLFKYYALGKVFYHLNRFAEARDALVFALSGKTEFPVDFVHELLARTYLAMGQPDQALKVIEQVPERLRRPYCRWTEAEVWCALKDFHRARRVLLQSQERDRRSKHKTLIRLAKINGMNGPPHTGRSR